MLERFPPAETAPSRGRPIGDTQHPPPFGCLRQGARRLQHSRSGVGRGNRPHGRQRGIEKRQFVEKKVREGEFDLPPREGLDLKSLREIAQPFVWQIVVRHSSGGAENRDGLCGGFTIQSQQRFLGSRTTTSSHPLLSCFEPLGGYRFGVYLTIPTTASEMVVSACRLATAEPGPFVLFVPSGDCSARKARRPNRRARSGGRPSPATSPPTSASRATPSSATATAGGHGSGSSRRGRRQSRKGLGEQRRAKKRPPQVGQDPAEG